MKIDTNKLWECSFSWWEYELFEKDYLIIKWDNIEDIKNYIKVNATKIIDVNSLYDKWWFIFEDWEKYIFKNMHNFNWDTGHWNWIDVEIKKIEILNN